MKELLLDKTTEKNIIWASGKNPKKEIQASDLPNILPRVQKNINQQTNRTKENAEVFTPSWVCNKQCNLIDREWFGKDVFNIENEDNFWIPITKKIEFPENKTWQDYVLEVRLEITCGEAPYLVSRYDTTTGYSLPIEKRIGFLDRKLRVVQENENSFEWIKNAFQNTYGYEYQGDNLYLARKNLYDTFLDYCPGATDEQKKEIINIIVWNIWQMDGLTCMIPLSEAKTSDKFGMFASFQNQNQNKLCKIMDWKENKPEIFINL